MWLILKKERSPTRSRNVVTAVIKCILVGQIRTGMIDSSIRQKITRTKWCASLLPLVPAAEHPLLGIVTLLRMAV